TFIKHDRVESQPNLLTNAKKQFLEVESLPIKHILTTEYPQHFALEPWEQAEIAASTDGRDDGRPDGRPDSRADADLQPSESPRDERPDDRPEARAQRASL